MDTFEAALIASRPSLVPALFFLVGVLAVHIWFRWATSEDRKAALIAADEREKILRDLLQVAEPPRHCTPWDFKHEALQCDVSDPVALEAFLARWRGRVPVSDRPKAEPAVPTVPPTTSGLVLQSAGGPEALQTGLSSRFSPGWGRRLGSWRPGNF